MGEPPGGLTAAFVIFGVAVTFLVVLALALCTLDHA